MVRNFDSVEHFANVPAGDLLGGAELEDDRVEVVDGVAALAHAVVQRAAVPVGLPAVEAEPDGGGLGLLVGEAHGEVMHRTIPFSNLLIR